MDKRALIGIALSVFVLVAYQQFINFYYGPPPVSEPAPPNVKSDAAPTAAPAPTNTPAAVVAPAAVAPVQIPAGQPAKEIIVDTDNYKAVFTSHGARLKSFKFKKYRSSADPASGPFEIVTAASGVPFPLGVRWQGAAPAAAIDDDAINYAVQGADLKLSGAAKEIGRASCRERV